MSWLTIVPGDRGEALRRSVLRAIEEAYDENVQRHAPDDLGDNNTTFGVNITHNLRHLVERDVGDRDDVEIVRPRNSFAMKVDGRFDVFLYKAPPGVMDVRSLRFDESEMKLAITAHNADQLSLFEALKTADRALPSHVVIVHFGDPVSGFQKAEVGAPFATALGGCDWAWHEPFADGRQQADADDDAAIPVDPSTPKTDLGGFGLRLREPNEDEGSADA